MARMNEERSAVVSIIGDIRKCISTPTSLGTYVVCRGFVFFSVRMYVHSLFIISLGGRRMCRQGREGHVLVL